MRIVLLAMLTICASLCAGEAAITIEAGGLSVTGKGYGGDMDGVRAFNEDPGTRVSLLARAPAGGLLSFNDDASKVKVFADDKGKVLNPPDKSAFRDSGFGMFAHVSKDSKACVFHAVGKEIPTKGATVLSVEGEAVFVFATQKQDFAAEKVSLKAGTKFKAGELNFEVAKYGKNDFDGENWPFEVEFAFKQRTASLFGVKFFDAAGAEIPCERGTSSRMSFGNSVNESLSFKLKKGADVVKVVATFWMDMKDVKVPFALKVGAGL